MGKGPNAGTVTPAKPAGLESIEGFSNGRNVLLGRVIPPVSPPPPEPSDVSPSTVPLDCSRCSSLKRAQTVLGLPGLFEGPTPNAAVASVLLKISWRICASVIDA